MIRQVRDRGSFSVEVAVIFPAFLAICSVVLVAGLVAQGEIDVRNAAQEGARAATLQLDAGSASSVGRSVALGQVSDCDSPNAEVDTTNFQPGGFVRVTVTCSVNAPLGQTRHMSATATEVIDTYREEP